MRVPWPGARAPCFSSASAAACLARACAARRRQRQSSSCCRCHVAWRARARARACRSRCAAPSARERHQGCRGAAMGGQRRTPGPAEDVTQHERRDRCATAAHPLCERVIQRRLELLPLLAQLGLLFVEQLRIDAGLAQQRSAPGVLIADGAAHGYASISRGAPAILRSCHGCCAETPPCSGTGDRSSGNRLYVGHQSEFTFDGRVHNQTAGVGPLPCIRCAPAHSCAPSPPLHLTNTTPRPACTRRVAAPGAQQPTAGAVYGAHAVACLVTTPMGCRLARQCGSHSASADARQGAALSEQSEPGVAISTSSRLEAVPLLCRKLPHTSLISRSAFRFSSPVYASAPPANLAAQY